MQWLSVINATDEPVFPVPVCRFWSNGKTIHYPNQKSPLPNLGNLPTVLKPVV